MPNVAISSGSSLVFESALSLHYLPEVRRLPINCYVKSARYGGQEVAATGFQPVAGASLEITLSALGAAQLTGSVADRRGACKIPAGDRIAFRRRPGVFRETRRGRRGRQVCVPGASGG